MTTIYNTYYPNIQDGKIDLKKVNFSAYVVDSTYVPDVEHKKADVTGRVITLRQVLVEGDISTLTMSEIVEKVKEKLDEKEFDKAAGFVVYDIYTQELCFYETFDKISTNGE